MKMASKVIFVVAVLFAAFTLSAYGIAAAAPGLQVGDLLHELTIGSAGESLGAASETPEVTGSPDVKESETPEATELDEADEQETAEAEDAVELKENQDFDRSDGVEKDDEDDSKDGTTRIIDGMTGWVASAWAG